MIRLTSVKGREGEEGEEEEDDGKSPGAVPSPEEVEGVQLLQADTVEKLPEEKQRMHCHRNEQALADFFAWAEPIVAAGVPTTVRGIYQRLSSIKDVSAEHRLDKTLQEMTLAQPHDVVVTILRCAPSCDRVAVTMWMAIVSSNRTAEKVLPELLCVLEDWPLHSTSTSDKDNSDVFSLAATRAVWEIIHLPQGPERMILYFPRLFVALLFQIFSSTEQMPEEVTAFWRRCQHKHCLPTNPNRFALLTMKALLCHLEYEDVVSEVERECGWDTLLNTDTHHYTVRLLARAMLRVSEPLCYRIARYLFRLLRREEAHWEVAAMAFLVEILPCLNIKQWGERILQLFQIYLWREHRVMRLLVLRCLMVLCKRPSLANTMSALTESLMEVLKDEDRELIEALRPLFDNDTSHVQLLSIRIFEAVMELVEEEGKEPLERIVRQSLFPLFRHLHDKNQFVAEASWETLLQATIFLKRWNLQQLLESEELWRFGECLLKEERDRADGYLRQSVMYLQSPQKSIREAAMRLTAPRGKTNKFSPSIFNLVTPTRHYVRTAETNPNSRFRLLQNQLREAWRRQASLLENGWPSLWHKVGFRRWKPPHY
uniref:Maestro heat like repeat family member 6 n=1 Tax=Ficedula albicollis TaxID=59894 RepID=A0A803VUA9_FICAL